MCTFHVDRQKKLNIFTLQKFLWKNLDLVGTKQNGKKVVNFFREKQAKIHPREWIFFHKKIQKKNKY